VVAEGFVKRGPEGFTHIGRVNAQGQAIGTVRVMLDGKEVASAPLVALMKRGVVFTREIFAAAALLPMRAGVSLGTRPVPGARVRFELVAGRKESHARGFLLENSTQEGLGESGEKFRFPIPAEKIALGAPMPDFELRDQAARPVRLTVTGERLLGHAQRILALQTEVLALVAETSGTTSVAPARRCSNESLPGWSMSNP